MKSSLFAMTATALLAFAAAGAVGAAAPAASPVASSAASTAASPAADTKKTASKKTAAKAAPANKPMPATTPPTTSRGNTAQQSKMGACATANKGKKGDDYKAGMSACLKASPASDKK
jgi:hypothetical protein